MLRQQRDPCRACPTKARVFSIAAESTNMLYLSMLFSDEESAGSAAPFARGKSPTRAKAILKAWCVMVVVMMVLISMVRKIIVHHWQPLTISNSV
jgi:hypothetical protein